MFNILDIPRDMDRAQWTKLYHIIRKHGDRPAIQPSGRAYERVNLRAVIDECLEDGQICRVTSGMDCDCSQYTHSTLIDNPTPMALLASEEDSYYWADGPMGIGYCKPSERPQSRSRDLALEAFEDGHPHVVYA